MHVHVHCSLTNNPILITVGCCGVAFRIYSNGNTYIQCSVCKLKCYNTVQTGTQPTSAAAGIWDICIPCTHTHQYVAMPCGSACPLVSRAGGAQLVHHFTRRCTMIRRCFRMFTSRFDAHQARNYPRER